MKTSKCLMGVLLSSVLLIGSVFAANTLHKDGIAVKDGFNMKGQTFHNGSCDGGRYGIFDQMVSGR